MHGVVTKRRDRVPGVANRYQERPDTIQTGAAKPIANAEGSEYCGEEHEENDDGRPPTQKTEKKGKTNRSVQNCQKEERNPKTKFASRSNRVSFQSIEIDN